MLWAPLPRPLPRLAPRSIPSGGCSGHEEGLLDTHPWELVFHLTSVAGEALVSQCHAENQGSPGIRTFLWAPSS